MNDFNEINRLRAQAEDARRQRLVPTTPKRPVTDEDRAALVVKALQEATSPDVIREAIRKAGFCQQCFGHVGIEDGRLNNCWGCYESRGE